LAIQNADLDTRDSIEDLFALVEKAYWKWVFAQRNLQIYRDILDKAIELHKTNTKNYDTGLIEKGDFLASQANVLIREKDMLLAENEYRNTEEDIKLLMNIEASERFHPKEELRFAEIELDADQCLRDAFQKRRDYNKAKRDVEIQDITLETKANERWPEIDLVATMAANGINSKLSNAADRITEEDNTYYYTGVEVSIPLENNLAKSEFKQAKHEKEKAILGLKQTERAIVTDVGNALRDYLTYQKNIAKLQEVSRLQNEKLKEEEKRFKYGRSNTKRLIDYQQDHLLAELALVLGLLDLEVARIDLEKSLDAILEKYEGML
jgi:outer membrane protein TolC